MSAGSSAPSLFVTVGRKDSLSLRIRLTSSSLSSWCVGCVNIHAHVYFVGGSLENSTLRVGREEKIDSPGYWAVAFHMEISYREQQTHWALGCRFNLIGQLLIMDSFRTQHHFYQLNIPTCQIFLSSSKICPFPMGQLKANHLWSASSIWKCQPFKTQSEALPMHRNKWLSRSWLKR